MSKFHCVDPKYFFHQGEWHSEGSHLIPGGGDGEEDSAHICSCSWSNGMRGIWYLPSNKLANSAIPGQAGLCWGHPHEPTNPAVLLPFPVSTDLGDHASDFLGISTRQSDIHPIKEFVQWLHYLKFQHRIIIPRLSLHIINAVHSCRGTGFKKLWSVGNPKEFSLVNGKIWRYVIGLELGNLTNIVHFLKRNVQGSTL